jgi:hypothetical protein
MTYPTPETELDSSVFYDSINPRDYPRGQRACFYADGLYRVTGADIAAVNPPDYRLITVTGNGRTCSIVDGRPDNNISPAHVRAFVRERRGNSQDAIIYCPRSWVIEYQQVLFDFHHGDLLSYEGLFWWIATLDGKPWTAAELSADLAENFDAELHPDRIWAVQWNQLPELGPNAKVDQSALFLPWRP